MRGQRMDLVSLFCSVDDFWQSFEKEWNQTLIEHGHSKRGPESKLSISEVMTIIILFHQSNYRTFKHFYHFLTKHMKKYFPSLVSYTRFVAMMKEAFVPLFAYLMSMMGTVTGVSFVDSTSIIICGNKRMDKNKVFKGFAKKGKTTIGWFYGFKLHLIINEKGELLSFLLTPGNIADVKVLDKLSERVFGKVFGDKGYISSELGKKLLKRGLELFTTLKSNMKQKLISMKDKILLRKRVLIETVNDQLKNISQIEHTRHRSIANFLVNLLSGLAAYALQDKKPCLNLNDDKGLPLMIVA